MSLTVISRIEDEFAVLELAGSLTLGPALSTLRETAKQVLGNQRVSGIILHMAGVTVTDTSGLGELTVIYTLATNRTCPIRLVMVKPNLQKILQMTRLDGLLPSSVDMATAKAELRRKAAAT